MKFICISDIHLSMYSQDSIIKGLPRRLHYLIETLNNIAEYAITNKIDNIVIAGDTFHTKSIIHALAQASLLSYVRKYKKLNFIIIDGNHDMSEKSGDGVSALMCLDNEPNVDMIHEPKQIENIDFIPWNPKTMKDDIRNSKAAYLVSHFGLNEATLNSGISIVSDIGLNDLKHFNACFIGHYHSPQQVGNVYIPGSIIQLDWGEKGEQKRFLVIDSETGTIHSINIEGYQQHVEFEITADNASIIIEKARELKSQGHFVKLNNIDNDFNPSDLGDEFHIVDKTEKDITNRGISTSMSTKDKLLEYLKIKGIPEEEHEEYLATAVNIIEGATNE